MVRETAVNEFGDGISWRRGPLIGKGGYGCVYLAKLKNSKSKYSYYPPLMAVKSAEVSASASIQKEKEVFDNVRGCPQIIKCFGEETTRGSNGAMAYNILLEYGSGGTLADKIRASGGDNKGLEEFEAKMFARSILKGLSHIHNLGYVHCDLKPENILLVKQDKGISKIRAKIGDLGLAKREEKHSTEKRKKKRRKLEPFCCWRGTPLYISPEAVIEGEQEAPCDIWAFGCTVLEMITGKSPWNEVKNGSKYEEIVNAIGRENALPEIPGGISRDARDFLMGCFVRNPKLRWCADMLLCHPFLSNLPEEEDEGGGGEEIEDVEVESIVFVCESEGDFEFSNDEYESVGYWSEEAVEEEENGTELEVVITSNETSEDVSETRQQKFPVNLTVATGLC